MTKLLLNLDFSKPFYIENNNENNNDNSTLLVYNDNIYMIQILFDNYIKINEINDDILVNIKINILDTKKNNRFQSNFFSTRLNNIIKNEFYFSLSIEDTFNIFGYNKKNKRILWKSKNDTKTLSTLIIDNIYHWNGELINGIFLWNGNLINNKEENISKPQVVCNINNYIDTIPENMNTIFLFTGLSNAKDVLNYLKNYTTCTNIFNRVQSYIKNLMDNNQPYLLSLVLGGKLQSSCFWDTGIEGTIYSYYEACTKSEFSFRYIETETGHTLNGIGTGILNYNYNNNYNYNSLCFNIETWENNSLSTSSENDFLNLFNYIKNNKNSTFYGIEMNIIVIITNSNFNYNRNIDTTLSIIYLDKNKYYDYICHKVYS